MAKWGYGKCDGPDFWAKDFPAAGGSRQSPINIVVNYTVFDSDLADNKLKLIIDPVNSRSQKLNFTGHNFKVDMPTDSMILTGVPGMRSDQFKLVQFHFHWSNKENESGSEHQVNGRGFPSELHLVHYNSTRYANIGEASDKPDGLVVLGVLFEIGQGNEEIEVLTKSLDNIKSVKLVDLFANDAYLNVKNLLPNNTDRFFTYPGSLTTPPCFESVTWIVFEQALTISNEQLSKFRRVHDDDCGTRENFRPVCPVHSRKVKRSFK